MEAPDYRTFDLACSHAELGYELGAHDPLFEMQPWWAPPPAPAFARSCAAVVRELHPGLLDETAGYAEAQRAPADELWRLCCRVNLKARVRVSAGGVVEAGEGCSTFAWRAGRRMIVGRNYDYWPMQARRQRIRFTPTTGGLASVGARGSVPCGRYDGMNALGVFASLHVVMTDTPDANEIRPGVPFHLAARLALELCGSAREAADLLSRVPHLSSLNYLVADAAEAFVVEADPRGARVHVMEGDVLAATNHFRHPDLQPLMGRRTTANSACRLAFMLGRGADGPSHPRGPSLSRPMDSNQRPWLRQVRAADGLSGDVDAMLAHAQTVMADRSAPLCGLSGPLTTLWSCVAELSTRRIRYAAGAPAHTPFVEIPGPKRT